MKRLAWAGALAALLTAAPAFPQWYGGISYGSVRTSVDESRINANLVNLGFFTAATSSDTSDASVRAFAGYRVLPWLDVEAYYAELGKTKFSSTVTPAGTLSVSIDSRAYGIAALPGFSPMERLRLYAKVGIAQTEAEATPSSSGFVDTIGGVSKKHTGGVYGAGVHYDLTPKISLRAEYDVHKDLGDDRMGGKFDAKTASIGVVVRF
jgi:opacity protein-like surface antigen